MFVEMSPIRWEEHLLSECCDILDHRRIPVSTDERARRKGSVPYYGANGQLGWIDAYLFDEDLILIAEDGGDFDNHATKPIAYRVSGKSWVNNHAHVLKVKAAFDQSFVFQSLVNKDIRFYIRGGTRSKLNKGELSQVRLSVPNNRSEQVQVGCILDTLDEAIRRTEEVIEKLKRIKAGLLHDLLTRGLDENGELRDPIRHPERFKDSPLGRIPKEWQFGHLGSQFYLQRGFDITVAEQRQGSVPVVSSSGITSYHDTAILSGPGVVIGRKGKLGGAFFVPGPYWPHDTSLWVKDFHGNCEKFAAIFLEFLRLERFDAATSVPTLNRNIIHPLIVAIPLRDEQMEIVKRAEAIEACLKVEEKSRMHFGLLKQGLMQDLLTGRVRVKVPEERGTC